MSQSPPRAPSNIQVITFIVILSFICALILSILSSALKKPQEVAQELDRSMQMMMAAGILNTQGYFQIQKNGKMVPAQFKAGGVLTATTALEYPNRSQLFEIYQKRLVPMLVTKEGDLVSFKKAGIDEKKYIQDHRKSGYYKLPDMLIYLILPNIEGKEKQNAQPIGYVIPINGYGLWDAIYGYLAIKPDGDTVIGIAWYDQKETPGLGAVISEPRWQRQFHGKKIFEPGPEGKTDFKSAPLGLTVIKGNVASVLGNKPKAESSIDGIPGATLTGNGVTAAYHDVLAPYRPFLIKLHEQYVKKQEKEPKEGEK